MQVIVAVDGTSYDYRFGRTDSPSSASAERDEPHPGRDRLLGIRAQKRWRPARRRDATSFRCCYFLALIRIASPAPEALSMTTAITPSGF